MAPAASKEDSRPQTILKFHFSSGLDYKSRYGLLVGSDTDNEEKKEELFKVITTKEEMNFL